MTVDEFWKIIEQHGAIAPGQRNSGAAHKAAHQRLQAHLQTLPPDAILGFWQIFLVYMKLSYRAKLWAAFFIKDGGCSDDGFDYARMELIGAGRAAFERLVTDPDRIADDEYADFYGTENHAAQRAYDAVKGAMAPSFNDMLPSAPIPDLRGEYARLGLDPFYDLDTDPVMRLDFEDAEAMSALLPRSWARYGRG